MQDEKETKHSLVILALEHLDQLRHDVLDEILRVLRRRPLGALLADVKERADDLQQAVDGALADTLVVVIAELRELHSALLDVGQEVLPDGREDAAERVRRDLLLDADRAVHVEQLVDVHAVVVVDVHVRVVRHVDRARGREPGRELRRDLWV